MDTIDEFERNSGVSLHSVDKLNPSRDAKGKAIRTMPISLKCKGTYDQILNSDHEMAPGLDKLTMDSPAPLRPDANGRYPIPRPGITKEREY